MDRMLPPCKGQKIIIFIWFWWCIRCYTRHISKNRSLHFCTIMRTEIQIDNSTFTIKGVFTNADRTHISRYYIKAQTQNGNTGLQYADRISQSRDTGETRDFISSHTGQSKTEIHRELESYNKEREHL